MVWWQWMVLAFVLLGAEMAFDAQFYLVFLGISALAVGLLDLAIPGSPIWVEWLLFSAIAIASLLVFRSKLRAKVHGSAPDLSEGIVGEIGTVEADIAAGAVGRIQLRGTTWEALNLSDIALPSDSRVRVESTSGLTAEVRPVTS
jgi:membrane protein implicated in regulation of membrane protease activity